MLKQREQPKSRVFYTELTDVNLHKKLQVK